MHTFKIADQSRHQRCLEGKKCKRTGWHTFVRVYLLGLYAMAVYDFMLEIKVNEARTDV